MYDLVPAIIVTRSPDEFVAAYEFLTSNDASMKWFSGAAMTSKAAFWQNFQPGGPYENEGTLCLRISGKGIVHHSGERYYRGEWARDYNHGDDYVSDDMFCISLDEYIFACTGVSEQSEFGIAEDADLLGIFQ